MQPPEFASYRRRLPHWRRHGATYFVTWRLGAMQPDLSPGDRSLVASTLRHFDGRRYELLAYVVMNDHVHALVTPFEQHSLEIIVQGWKSYTAHALIKEGRRVGPVWQGEYFDRVVRDDAELMEKAEYILNNPRKRWPDLEQYEWVAAMGLD